METLKEETIEAISKLPESADIDEISPNRIEILAIIHGKQNFEETFDIEN